MTRLCFALLLLVTVMVARAENLPREFTITPTELKEPPAFLTQVIVPDANCAAVNEDGSLLVIGHRGKDEKTKYDSHLAVFRLGVDGKPAGEPAWITLPKPAALADKTNYPLGLLFHPKLPLLYVWQDVDAPPGDKQEKHPDFAKHLEFDHLIIYAIKNGALEQVSASARGTGFHCGLNGGTIGLDFEAKILFVPNATGATPDEGAIAYFSLDDDGLPGETPGLMNTKLGKAAQNVNMSRNRTKELIRAMAVPRHQRTYRYFPTGAGWFAGSEAMLMGGYSGCMVADFHNGSLRQSWFTLPDLAGHCALAGHPTLPAAYICLQDHSHFYQIAQVNGYLTMLPQVATVTGAHLIGKPVVLTKQARIAIGDTKSVHLLGLQADGKLDGKDDHLKVPCAIVKGIAYSEKHDRLYVAVDAAK